MVTLDDRATAQDSDYLRALHEATLSAPMKQVLGRDEEKQLEWLRANFDPDGLRMLSLDHTRRLLRPAGPGYRHLPPPVLYRP